MNYAEFVNKLKEGHTFDAVKDRVPPEALIDGALMGMVVASKDIDAAKKKLFYNKPDPRAYWNHVHDHPRAQPALSYDAVSVDALHAIVGICSEAGELAELLIDALEQGRDIDVAKTILEAGDMCWYLQLLANSMGVRGRDFIDENIAKLTKRYGAEFTPEKAIARADETLCAAAE